MNYSNMTIMVYLIDSCNMNCSYCYNRFPRSRLYLDSNVIFRYLQDIAFKTKRKISLLFIGGEPTLYPNFLSFLKKMKSISDISSIELFTNMTLSLEFYENIVNDDISINASWHSQNLDFSKKLVLLSKKHKKHVNEIAIMLEHDNLDAAFNVVKLLYPIYKDVVKIWPLYQKFSIYDYTSEQKNIFSKMSKYVNSNMTFEDSVGQYTEKFKGKSCSAGYDSLYVHCDGNVYKCQNDFFYDKKPLYNILENLSFDMSKYKDSVCQCDYCRHGNFDVKIY